MTRGDERPVFPFQSSNASVRIDGDNQAITEATRLLKAPDMPNMEKIEAAIGEYDRLTASARGADFPNCGLKTDHFCLGD